MALYFYAGLAGFLVFERVQSNSPEAGEVFSGVVLADTAVIFTKTNLKRPVKIVFNSPVAAHRVSDSFRIGAIQTAE